ncbi:hypothetical protein MLD38_009361 [Melastoma candidum]|uniref:Uncharacterized protein n=1 Tax=Melastoma candidum TaxID=119954 RepID=A0ACB9RX98_9MYRT|nr:hypothetical protein MLD38_009361 [Melastoma candidum]
MVGRGRSGKQPQSLNDSHYRFLQFSSSKRHLEMEGLEDGFGVDRSGGGDLLPRFNIMDSSPEMEDKRPVAGAGRSSDDSMPRFKIVDSPSASEEEKTAKIERNRGFQSEAPQLNHEDDGNRRGNHEQKIKIQGRRRLCKLSSCDGDVGVNVPANEDKGEFVELNDYDSPVVERNHGDDEKGGRADDIRDILNDLSSKFELLSVEKRKVPKEKYSTDECNFSLNGMDKESKAVVPEFASAGSSFSLSPDSSKELAASPACSAVNSFESVVLGNTLSGVVEELGYTHKTSSSDCEEDSDCIMLSEKCLPKKAGGKISQIAVTEECDDSVNISDRHDDSIEFVLKGPRATYRLPPEISKILYPYQLDGLRWLWSLHSSRKGGILGDDMGLGKTMQICGFLAGLFHSRLIKRAIIVAPKTLLSHWIKELSTVGLSEMIREYYGTCPKARQYELQYVLQDKGILLTTYDIVRNNSKALQGSFNRDHDWDEDSFLWDYIILDEGHLIKNPSTQRAKSLLDIPAAHRIIISGTPIQNNLRELWALFNFCCPGLLGDKIEFKGKYEDPILRGNEKKATEREKQIGSTVAKDLREHIQPYFLRRLKSEIFPEDNSVNVGLSRKNELIVWLRMTNCQRRLYEAFLKSELVLSAFDGSPLAALTILKKICDHPLLLTQRAAEDVLEGMDSMVSPEDVIVAERLASHIANMDEGDEFLENQDSLSCKTSFIMSLLGQLIPEGHSVLIFSQTRKMLNLIQESLASSGYKYQRIDGTTKACDRTTIVNDFQEHNGAPIFLLTSQVGGLGLTLTRADRVIVVDPAWNPSTDNQSVDRAYRIGQKKDVIVYRLMTCGTVEEKIYRKQVFKGGLFKSATEHKEQMRYFSQQDLRELFSLPKEGFDVSPTQQQLHDEHDSQHQMSDFLRNHINYLETLGIAGVSHHSLLYSKTAPVQVTEEEVEVPRPPRTGFVGATSRSTSVERDVEGAEFAFNPKDIQLNRKSQSPESPGKSSEPDIKGRIDRLARMLANEAMVARLPDKGERIRRQIGELSSELDKIRVAERASMEKEVIDLDEISGNFQKLMNV